MYNITGKTRLIKPIGVNVTSDKSMVDTVDMLFNYPGFYKIEMVAENVCGRTFLSTEDLRWTEKNS